MTEPDVSNWDDKYFVNPYKEQEAWVKGRRYDFFLKEEDLPDDKNAILRRLNRTGASRYFTELCGGIHTIRRGGQQNARLLKEAQEKTAAAEKEAAAAQEKTAAIEAELARLKGEDVEDKKKGSK